MPSFKERREFKLLRAAMPDSSFPTFLFHESTDSKTCKERMSSPRALQRRRQLGIEQQQVNQHGQVDQAMIRDYNALSGQQGIATYNSLSNN